MKLENNAYIQGISDSFDGTADGIFYAICSA